jgi:hypothetical protein
MSSKQKDAPNFCSTIARKALKQLSQNIRQKEQATRELTAKLRAERLARDAKTNTLKTVPKPKAN